MHSAVLILPIALRDVGNQIGAAMGWGPVSYTISLASNPDGEATHIGLRADVHPSFIDMIEAAQQGIYPPTLSAELLQPVIDSLIYDFSPDPNDTEKPVLWGVEHFEYVCNKHQLVRC